MIQRMKSFRVLRHIILKKHFLSFTLNRISLKKLHERKLLKKAFLKKIIEKILFERNDWKSFFWNKLLKKGFKKQLIHQKTFLKNISIIGRFLIKCYKRVPTLYFLTKKSFNFFFLIIYFKILIFCVPFQANRVTERILHTWKYETRNILKLKRYFSKIGNFCSSQLFSYVRIISFLFWKDNLEFK